MQCEQWCDIIDPCVFPNFPPSLYVTLRFDQVLRQLLGSGACRLRHGAWQSPMPVLPCSFQCPAPRGSEDIGGCGSVVLKTQMFHDVSHVYTFLHDIFRLYRWLWEIEVLEIALCGLTQSCRLNDNGSLFRDCREFLWIYMDRFRFIVTYTD